MPSLESFSSIIKKKEYGKACSFREVMFAVCNRMWILLGCGETATYVPGEIAGKGTRKIRRIHSKLKIFVLF